ncbi:MULTISPECIES: type II toxin-antitoxin system HicB family antitoxin [unclassified Mesorhizobium]|uniref:type II toxin-antitoxin system HicB family antitoxin n=1 Tax=unclassified Mesorhizobium TaxID=325217 RepID=UPI0024163F3C|nr:MULTISPECIES: type II toxin-antitoxin system HicB family antitoxin [unclassified Mesorhizobium]WFP61147.1 type II toxin-antitoxin system HicB family antitoxin [Mesorhizobium sp. WSM4904]WFP74375.1 type II toxin-antitoxin system HicB family antitoxin [Mesorhizobium sp. WSM4906]
MKSYFALVDKDAGSAFGIRFPDIPGCFSAADAAEEIIPNAVEALQLWAEDMPVPEPSSHEAIVSLSEVRTALAEGAYLVSVPLIDNDSAVVRANVTFERGVLRAIDAAARERGITRSAFLASAARKEIEAKH